MFAAAAARFTALSGVACGDDRDRFWRGGARLGRRVLAADRVPDAGEHGNKNRDRRHAGPRALRLRRLDAPC